MNGTVFWRIVWKEYRAQRAFWISIALLIVIVELLLVVNYWQFYRSAAVTERIRVLFSVGLGLVACYALASGATLFATEREGETYEFLRGLPVNPLVVFAAKVVLAVFSTAVLFIMAWMLALVLTGKLPEPVFQQGLWALWGLGGVELMAWGILFSLLLRRALVAAICAVTVASGMLWICGLFCIVDGGTGQFADIITKTVSGRLLIVALLVAADTGLAARWFRERWVPTTRGRDARLSEEQIEAIFSQVLPAQPQSKREKVLSDWAFDRTPSTRSMLGRLVWQEFRQSAAISAGLIAMLLPMVLYIYMPSFYLRSPGPRFDWIFGLFPMLLLPAFFSAPLLGSSAFLADQTGCRFRFLAERGIPPRLVWSSRHLRGLFVMLLGMLLALLLCLPFLMGLATKNNDADLMEVVVCCAGFAVVAYACGQLSSMGIRSGLLAAFFGTVLAAVVCVWAAIMYALCLSWLWSVAPILLAFLIVTWLHAPNWLVERKSWAARLRLALVVAVPVVAILAAVPLVRLYEIPLVGPGFDVEEFTRPVTAEDKETLALYQRAFNMYESGVPKWVGVPASDRTLSAAEKLTLQKATDQAVKTALEASRRPLPRDPSDLVGNWEVAPEDTLCRLVLENADRLQSEGKLDAALDRYVAAMRIAITIRRQDRFPQGGSVLEIRACKQLAGWAAQSGQTPERVARALRTMEQQWRNTLSYSYAIKQGYLRNLQYLQSACFAGGNEYSYLWWLPWERARTLRLLNKMTAEELARCQEYEETLAIGGHVDQPSDSTGWPKLDKDLTYRLVRPMVKPFMSIVVNGRDAYVGNLGDFLELETYRRATRLILALEAWKLEHGRLPKSLDHLQGKYFDQLPVGPYTGHEFRYEPNGLPDYIVWWTYSTAEKTIEPDRPFLACDTWSRSSWFASAYGEATEGNVGASEGKNGSPRTESWKGDWVFQIP